MPRAPIWIAVALAGVAAMARGDMEGPFQTRNENPVCRLYGVPQGGGGEGESGTGFFARATFDVSNTSIDEFRESETLVLDGETRVAQLALGHRWKNGWGVALQVPYVAHGGGELDGFLDRYHSALGLPRGNRRRREDGRLDYFYRRGNQVLFNVADSTAGLGDVRMSCAARLWRGAAGLRALDGVAGVELPTGDADSLLGSGSVDAWAGFVAVDRALLARWDLGLSGAAGLLAMTPGGPMEDVQRAAAGYGFAAVDWTGLDWLRPRVQLDWHSPLFRGVESVPFRAWSATLAAGVRVRLPGEFALDVALAEDISVDTAPDVAFHLGIQRRLR